MKRRKPVRKPLSEDLPREIIEIDITDEEKQCDGCGGELRAFGHETSTKLDYRGPPQVKVLEFRRLKYACACESGVKTAPAPKMPIPKKHFKHPDCWPGSLLANTAMHYHCTVRNSFSSAWVPKSPVRHWLNG